MGNQRPARGPVEDRIVVEVPVACKSMVDSIEAVCAAAAASATSAQRGGEAVNYASVEREIGELTAAVECAAHGCTLSTLEVDAARVEVGCKPVGRGKGKPGRGNAPAMDAISLGVGANGDGWCHGLPGRWRTNSRRRPRLMREFEIPEEARAVTVSLDRASLPMPGSPRKDAPKIQRTFRQAYCGTVTMHNSKGRALHTIRFAQMSDGSPRAIHAAKVVARVTQRWKESLKRRKNDAREILREFEASGCEEIDGSSAGNRPVHDAITHLRNHSDRMNYAGAHVKGLPLGSGNVEASCKTLIGVRMMRAGSRWRQQTDEHVIKLRTLPLSDQWDGADGDTEREVKTTSSLHARFTPERPARSMD